MLNMDPENISMQPLEKFKSLCKSFPQREHAQFLQTINYHFGRQKRSI